MKSLHREDLFMWSAFDEARNIDFNSVFWRGPGLNIVVDPLPLGDHDRAHIAALGGIDLIVLTNADHVRDTQAIRAWSGAKVVASAAEQTGFPIPVDVWAGPGFVVAPGMVLMTLQGSKTPEELAILLGPDTLIFGDLVRAHGPTKLHLLPDQKLSDRVAAVASVARMAEIDGVETLLLGDGWSVFGGGQSRLAGLAAFARGQGVQKTGA